MLKIIFYINYNFKKIKKMDNYLYILDIPISKDCLYLAISILSISKENEELSEELEKLLNDLILTLN